MPASWIAQDPILNQELLISTSIPYNRIDMSPLRMRRGSVGGSLRHDARTLGQSVDSLAPDPSSPATPDVSRSKKSSISQSGPGQEAFDDVPASAKASSGAGNCSTVVECDEPEEEATFGFFRNDRDDETSGRGSMCDTSLHNASTESDKTEPQSCKFTPKQWTILVILLLGTLTSSFAVCLFPPFYPRLAEEKGATASIYGFVIGTNCLTSFLVTPIIGKNLNKFGVMFSMVAGTLIGGLCCAISGFLAYFSPGWGFVVTSCLIRILHAIGNALVITGTFTYAAMEYQDAVGKIFSFTRTAMNLGQLLGPLVGGALYQLGGFYLPFVTMGGLQAFMGLVSIILLDEIQVAAKKSNQDSKEAQTSKKITIFNILSIPSIWFSFITFIVATMCNGFLSINLEPKVLRRFKLTPLWVGLLFGIKDGANSLSSPIWGYFCDKSRQRSVKPYLVLSALCVATSFIFMGAGAVIGVTFNLSVAVLVFVLCLNGVGVGGEQVVGVVDALHEATNAGYPDDPSMHGIIAGLWSSLSGAGRFISRVGTGILVDCIGFNPTAAIMTTLQLAIAALTFIYMVFWECSLKRQASIIWESVTSVVSPGEDRLIFTQATSPSHSLMSRTVSIHISKRPFHTSSFSSLRSMTLRRPRGFQQVESSSVPDHMV